MPAWEKEKGLHLHPPDVYARSPLKLLVSDLFGQLNMQTCSKTAGARGPLAGLPQAPHRHIRIRTHASGSQQPPVDKGLSVLEWTNKLLPQTLLVSGAKEGWRLAWQTMVKELAPQTKSGAYERPSYRFTGRIGDAQFPVGNACPWCHRVLIALVLRGLARSAPSTGVPHISITHLADEPTKARRGGWVFSAQEPDPVWGAKDLWQVYDTVNPGFTGRCTAPLLVDRKTRRIVSNESADIVQMFNDLHLEGCTDVDLYPAAHRVEIERLNEQIYDCVNNGVYKSGFATSQQAYNDAQTALYRTLDELDARLSKSDFLLGDKLTMSDVFLLPTLCRMDAVYSTIFKCTKRRVQDYPALSRWLQRMWSLQVPGSLQQLWDTVDVDAARQSYFTNLFPLNPSGIIPAGPTALDLGLAKGSPGKVAEDVAHRRRTSVVV